MNLSEPMRAWIYRVALALVVLATAFGVLADEAQIASVVGVITALIGNTLATANTSTKEN